MKMSLQFVDGWTIAEVLGEGAFGEVKLLVNNETRDAVAVKQMNTGNSSEARMGVRKEIAVHKPLNHPNIIRYFGHRSEPNLDYIFLEYAAGGELFDRIEPDIGMDGCLAQKYFLELVSAVDYLHERGVTHRDIKPENILLSDQDHVKLSDFGMATMFRKNGVERLLDKKCGTMPYVAPEVLLRPYHAAPADVWSCGVVLVTMLAGGPYVRLPMIIRLPVDMHSRYPSPPHYPHRELPWDTPAAECSEFVSWKDGILTQSPWCKLDTTALSLLRRILSPLAHKRPAAGDIPKERWCRTKQQQQLGRAETVLPPAKRLSFGLERTCSEASDSPVRLGLSQPLPLPVEPSPQNVPDDRNYLFFSQPTALDDMLLSSQLHVSQAPSTPGSYQRLVKRMTRVMVGLSTDECLKRLTGLFSSMGCGVRCPVGSSVLTVHLTDRRKMQLTFKVSLLPMDGNILIDFRLSKGDGLEFKKLFLKVRDLLNDVVEKNLPWSLNPAL